MVWEQICPLPAKPLEAATFLEVNFSYSEIPQTKYSLDKCLNKDKFFYSLWGLTTWVLMLLYLNPNSFTNLFPVEIHYVPFLSLFLTLLKRQEFFSSSSKEITYCNNSIISHRHLLPGEYG